MALRPDVWPLCHGRCPSQEWQECVTHRVDAGSQGPFTDIRETTELLSASKHHQKVINAPKLNVLELPAFSKNAPCMSGAVGGKKEWFKSFLSRPGANLNLKIHDR